jgi:hypothetical protein
MKFGESDKLPTGLLSLKDIAKLVLSTSFSEQRVRISRPRMGENFHLYTKASKRISACPSANFQLKRTGPVSKVRRWSICSGGYYMSSESLLFLEYFRFFYKNMYCKTLSVAPEK